MGGGFSLPYSSGTNDRRPFWSRERREGGREGGREGEIEGMGVGGRIRNMRSSQSR